MRILSFGELASVKGINLCKSLIYSKIAKGEFPKPIKISENRVAFVEAEIDAYLAARIAERDRKAA